MLAAVLALTVSASPPAGPLHWIHDDYAAAAAEASKQKKLVAVDVWATWCHTCLSMKGYVLTEPALGRVADTHVYLALDYDRESNADFFAKYPVSAFPSFLVIDPAKEEVVARWIGSGSADDMARFFARAANGKQDALASVSTKAATGDKKALQKLRAMALNNKVSAADRARPLLSYIEALYKSDKPACAKEASKIASKLTADTAGVDTGALGAYCALSLDKNHVKKKAWLTSIRAGLARLEALPKLDVSADDRSSLRGILIDLHDALGDEAAGTALTKTRLADLNKMAAAATSPAQRVTFDYHRMQAYLRLGQHKEAVSMLVASERDQPEDFNHPWRLALVYLDANELDLARAAIDRALARGYGGRRVRLYSTKIDILKAAGDLAAARAAYKEGRAHLDKTPAAIVRPYWRNELMSKEAELTPPRS